MVYVCNKCGRWLRSVDKWLCRTSRSRAAFLYCPTCNLKCKNPYFVKHVKLLDSFSKTKLGNRFKVEVTSYGRQVILFPVGPTAKVKCYAPTEFEIFKLHDPEIVMLYEQVDASNNALKENRVYHVETSNLQNWYKKHGV
jgi:hypothetical protein